MELLFRAEAGQTIEDISLIMKTILRTVIQTTIRLPRSNELTVLSRIVCIDWYINKFSCFQKTLVSIMIAIFRQMTAHHFEQYFEHFHTRSDLLDFLMEILAAFKDLVSIPVYPKDWCDMIMLQNRFVSYQNNFVLVITKMFLTALF